MEPVIYGEAISAQVIKNASKLYDFIKAMSM